MTNYTNELPKGAVIMWHGNADDIPDGWMICDGQNDTPDLRDRFIVGAGNSYQLNDTGGENKVVLDNIEQIPKHSHSGTTSENGSHKHKFSKYDGWAEAGGTYWQNIVRKSSNSDSWTESDGNHQHNFTTSEVGGNMPHENRPPYYALFFIKKVI